MSMFGIVCGMAAAAIIGMCGGVALASRPAYSRSARGRSSRSASKLIAFGVLFVDGSATYIVLYLCYLSIKLQFSGSLPYLTTLIGALQAATGYVLGHYFKKAAAENRKGGITYDAAMKDSEGDL